MAKLVNTSGLKQLSDGFKSVASSAMSAATSIGRIVPGMAALTGVASLAGMAKLVTDFGSWTRELQRAGDLLNETPEQLSRSEAMMRRFGGSTADAVNSLKELQSTTYDAALGMNGTLIAGFVRAGIAVRDFNGNLRNSGDVQRDLFGYLDRLTNGEDRLREATRLAGRSTYEVYETYRQSGLTLQQWYAQQQRIQALTTENVKVYAKYNEALQGMNSAFYQLGIKVGGSVAPVLTKLLTNLSNWVDAHGDDIAEKIGGIAKEFEEWIDSGSAAALARDFGTLLNVMLDVARVAAQIVRYLGDIAGRARGMPTATDILNNSPLAKGLSDDQKRAILAAEPGAHATPDLFPGIGPFRGESAADREARIRKELNVPEGASPVPYGGATPDVVDPRWGRDFARRFWPKGAPAPAPAPVNPRAPAIQPGAGIVVPSPNQPATTAAPIAPAPNTAAAMQSLLPKGTRDDPVYVSLVAGAVGGAGGAPAVVGPGGVMLTPGGGGGAGGGSGGLLGGQAPGGGVARPPGRFGGAAPRPAMPTPEGPPVASLAESRQRLADELKANPALREKMLTIAAGEQTNPEGNQAVIETMFNRAAAQGTSLAAQVRTTSEGGYYAGYSPANLAAKRKMIEANLDKVIGGSNISNYATDNASSWLADKRIANREMQLRYQAGGESFFSPSNARIAGAGVLKKYNDWLARVSGGPPGASPGRGRQDARTTPAAAEIESLFANPNAQHSPFLPNTLLGKLPANTTGFTGDQPDWVKKRAAELRAQGVIGKVSPQQMPNGSVNVNVTHKNPPAGTTVETGATGNGVTVGPTRVEHQQWGTA
jgi:hypothetical protein